MATTTDAALKSRAWELVVTRALDAPRPLVFKAWTEPQRLVRWWGPRGFTTPSLKMDVRPGGTWRACMRSPEGVDHWVSCVYREVVEPERLVFTWAHEDAEGNRGHQTLVTVTFVAQGEQTKLVVQQATFEADEARDAHEKGWAGCLECLAEYLAEG